MCWLLHRAKDCNPAAVNAVLPSVANRPRNSLRHNGDRQTARCSRSRAVPDRSHCGPTKVCLGAAFSRPHAYLTCVPFSSNVNTPWSFDVMGALPGPACAAIATVVSAPIEDTVTWNVADRSMLTRR